MAAQAAEVVRPNIVFILADDLGWRDLGCFGSTYYKTPNIDALAARGMKFTQAYAANPLCSPTRASIMTGLYPARLGITTPSCHMPQVILQATLPARAAADKKCLTPTSVTRLNTNYVTLADTLKSAGYATGHFGKWHLGAEPYSPLQHGFEVDVPHWHGPGPAGSYIAPWKFPVTLNFTGQPGEHIEDRMASEAVKFIKANKNHPFYLNYWAFSVHSPFDAKESLIERYRAAMDENVPQHNPLYAAMVHSLDDGVGTLVKALEAEGILDKTLIVFFSDNGGVNWQAMKTEGKGGPKGRAADFAEIPPTSNLPLRGGKASIYEGGTREPCFVVWPGTVKPGLSSDALIQSIDWYPTLAEIVGVPLPKEHKIDGRSFLPVLKGESTHHRDTIFTYFPHHTPASQQLPAVSVRRGDLKLIRFFQDGTNFAHRYELYNLREDLSEARDLAVAQPAMVKELDALIEGFLQDTAAVVPLPNPAYGTNSAVPPDPLQGWKARNCDAVVKAGVLQITSKGPAPFLGFGTGKSTGPATIKFRANSAAGGAGKIEWLSSGQSGDALKAQAVPFQLPGGNGQEVSVTVPPPGLLGILRIYLPATTQPVELEWIELKAEGKLRRWKF